MNIIEVSETSVENTTGFDNVNNVNNVNDVNDVNDGQKLDPEKIAIMTDRLKRIKSKIENMDKSNQISALYMLTKNKKIKYSENNNGTFINLTDIEDNMLLKIEEFIEYIELQKYQIDDIEKKKDYIENIYFKQNKD